MSFLLYVKTVINKYSKVFGAQRLEKNYIFFLKDIRLEDMAFEGFHYLVFHDRMFFPQRYCVFRYEKETQDFSGKLIHSSTLK